MEWTDDAIVLASRPHGETSTIVTLLTRAQGRHAGLVHGGTGTRARGLYQPGNRVRATWRGRLAEHLGHYTAELLVPHAATVMDDPLRLAGLMAACAVAEGALPEREPHPAMFDGFEALLTAMPDEAWPAIYVRLELGLLQELGFGLDLQRCAVTGEAADLGFVSPRSGRAVSRAAAAPYRDRLLVLPRFLAPGGQVREAGPADLLDGLELTGFFLERHVFWPHGKTLPAGRSRFIDRLRDIATISGS